MLVLNNLETDPKINTTDTAIKGLRQLCLDDFGVVLLNMPVKEYPKLSSLLPKMADAKVQKSWTGATGLVLLQLSLNFTRMMQYRKTELTGTGLKNQRILDYGCGYGRFLRLMSYYADSNQLFGCDPWDKSIQICKEDGINCQLDITDYLPTSLPYEEKSLDFIFAFSTFTHTSYRATQTALNALYGVAKKGGILAITIRPSEYWTLHAGLSDVERQSLVDDHNNKGYAFKPHNRAPVDGDITYGDTSMPIHMISQISPNWKMLSYDRTIADPYQIIVFLEAR